MKLISDTGYVVRVTGYVLRVAGYGVRACPLLTSRFVAGQYG